MQLIRVKDAAKRYSLSPFTIYRWSCDGKFPTLFARLGKILYVNETELKKLAKEDGVKNLVRKVIQEYKEKSEKQLIDEE